MIAVDTNILVYAHRRDSEFHATAAETIRELAESPVPWSIPWPCIHEFCAIVTHPRIYDPPTDIDAAADQVDAWLEAPTLVMLTETPAHWSHLRGLLTGRRIAGAQVHDARIAAICTAHGVSVLLTADRDFSRFPELATKNPLLPT